MICSVKARDAVGREFDCSGNGVHKPSQDNLCGLPRPISLEKRLHKLGRSFMTFGQSFAFFAEISKMSIRSLFTKGGGWGPIASNSLPGTPIKPPLENARFGVVDVLFESISGSGIVKSFVLILRPL